MRRVVVAIFMILIVASIKTDFLYSAPTDEVGEIKNKLSTLEEEISYLEKEISRDKDISSWAQNTIALKITRDYLKRDLPEKKRILDNLKRDFGDELKDEIGFISQNIEKENEIISDVRIDIGTIKFTQAYITETFKRKNEMTNTFRGKTKELKDKLEKAKKEDKGKEMKK